MNIVSITGQFRRKEEKREKGKERKEGRREGCPYLNSKGPEKSTLYPGKSNMKRDLENYYSTVFFTVFIGLLQSRIRKSTL